MYKIIRKRVLNPYVKSMDIHAPAIAKKAEPGQFIILRVYEGGERIPLTIADYNRVEGTVTIIFQEVGKTTQLLGNMEEGQHLLDFVGPLGEASHLEGYKKVAVIGGGLGTAIAFPQAKKLHSLGAQVHLIAGFRNKDLIILEEEMTAISDEIFITTDDGSNGNKGFVTNVLQNQIDQGNEYDLVIAIGPLPMMKAVCDLTRDYEIKTIISMNPVMIDGTGMCGGCRVTVGGKTKFACVDGPDFDGHLIDFDEAMRRQSMYKDQERSSAKDHECTMGGVLKNA
ncbi:sulfide/dihydroorotate dehydrogenase-like FAD/NAD-binding protein [Irregularibacter muris]|uniref:Sulfide/dihydroorotate dehydrogenase-like FAD/NAD-binding protein n=1 Tax=Irregularibacter muris TaxID=1796619 RepID=A0AAE3KYV2_9FIRM|nr:sulfide/dihydroorotate dehydrogenase-like FAD/NAD-binding protein [Irregularibacter muris]MCR1897646.1 sulfide/dihydroorotate dehydrogenase-like FAD/NAD-binding protein [Irregularibacter muris]